VVKKSSPGPVVVGGTGGSGTRVVARILIALGVDMGATRNPADDSLPFAAFDWRWGREVVAAQLAHRGASGRLGDARRALESVLRTQASRTGAPWGWKHPHSYLLLPFLRDAVDGLRFVHVMRDGRDNALSSNQRQLDHYGPLLLGPNDGITDRRCRAAAFWSRANGLAADTGQAELTDAYMRLRLEDLCADPAAGVDALIAFAGVHPREEQRATAIALVTAPASLGRWRAAPPSLRAALEQAARQGLTRFGYATARPSRRCCGRPLNLLLFMTDQHRWDALGCVGHWVQTPNLDWIGSEGVRFNNAYTNSPACVPARVSLATGRYPHDTGVWRNEALALSRETSTWMGAVRAAGYATSVFGKTHLHPHVGDLRDREHVLRAAGLDHIDEIAGPRASARCRSDLTDRWEAAGVYEAYRRDLRDRYATKPWVARPSVLPLDLYPDVYVGRQAAAHLRAYDGAMPWFCWVSFGGPHEPWDAPEPYASRYDPEAMPPPIRAYHDWSGRPQGLLDEKFTDGGVRFGPGDVGRLRANYAGKVTLIDDQVGEVLKVVADLDELDCTVVAFVSDHGEMNGDHNLLYKNNFLGPAVRVPFIVRLPLRCSGARNAVSDSMVELMDLGATLVELAGGRQVPGSQARSLVPLLSDPARQHRRLVVSELNGEAMAAAADLKVMLNRAGNIYHLYDLVADPHETRNLAGSSARDSPLHSRALEMAAWLRAIMARAGRDLRGSRVRADTRAANRGALDGADGP
jgi:choline-sulfatase